MTARLALLAIAWLAAPAAAKPASAVAQLEATYRPLASGADRTRRACADVTKLRAAVAGLPRAVPSGAPVDDDAWHAAVGTMGLAVENLASACRAPDLKVRHIGGQVETADDCLASVDRDVEQVIDQTKPRNLVPAMKRFQTTLKALLKSPASKQVCKQRDELARLLADLEATPPHANTQKWEQAHGLAARNLDQMKRSRCSGQRGADEEFADALTQVHDGYYQLVLLFPPRDD